MMCICQTSAFPIRILGDCSPRTVGTSMATNPMERMSPTCHPYSLFEEDKNISIQEDETCFLLTIEMPNVHESDVQISLRENVLTISGFRRIRFHSDSESFEGDKDDRRSCMDRSATKRQRVNRQLEIDPNVIDIDRAMASTYNGCYTLYAPKRRPPFR